MTVMTESTSTKTFEELKLSVHFKVCLSSSGPSLFSLHFNVFLELMDNWLINNRYCIPSGNHSWVQKTTLAPFCMSTHLVVLLVPWIIFWTTVLILHFPLSTHPSPLPCGLHHKYAGYLPIAQGLDLLYMRIYFIPLLSGSLCYITRMECWV